MNQLPFRRRVGTAARAASLLLCSGVFGCSSTDHLKKQVGALENEITAMRADQDRLEERLAAVELSASVPRTAPRSAATERVERPRLKIIHLEPEESDTPVEPSEPAESPSAEPATHRPVIRGTGDRVIKVGDGDASDESTRRDAPPTSPLADLGDGARGSRAP
jgi:hypothetical protein